MWRAAQDCGLRPRESQKYEAMHWLSLCNRDEIRATLEFLEEHSIEEVFIG